MKCVIIGDVFITPNMMEQALDLYNERYMEVKSFYFGINDRKKMRDVVKAIEINGPYAFPSPEGLIDEIIDADVLMVHLCPITKEVLERAPKLKLILSNRGGTENIDMKATERLNIKVLTNPAHNANAVAEYTIGLILNELRNISRSHTSLINGTWRESYPNSVNIKEISKMIVGIIGFGSVGKLVVEKLSGFKCPILVYDPFVDNIDQNNLKFVPLKTLLNKSDIITLHARSNEKKPLIGEEEFNEIKPDAYLINTARSYLVDMEALYNKLKRKELCGAAIDVFDIEPLPVDYKFLSLDNITLTNHRGGDTLNAYSDSPLMMLRQAEKVFTLTK